MANEQNAKFVAIVDHDDSVQSALQDLMEADGLSARCFGSAKEFLESGLQARAACLIVDIRMPGMSGLELQARLKGDRFNAPNIFITAHGDARVRMQAVREGAAEFLVSRSTSRSYSTEFEPHSICEEPTVRCDRMRHRRIKGQVYTAGFEAGRP